ncbi:Flp pilus assembly protein TadC [Terriglobus roseus DSM 18391]|uniref:Flp pilus assembly protein TadC n=1 Tax=Terriglobus roseus (strain DSM 18391 / NRRL B-41598 / KBS 63) TaxID=926566 RepID=I3ZLH8_TERRK|nr:type II secretion system F family protein [Terriglobus roseus]AFL90096.1 Flp pilus assembly protein TadC [Terriglobus roseus DSM 18391]
METVFLFAAAFTVFCISALVVAPVLLRPDAEARRIFSVVETERTDHRSTTQKEQVEEAVLHLSRGMRERLGISLSSQLQKRLTLAGIRTSSAPDIFFAAQFLTPLVGAFLGSFIAGNTWFWIFAFAAAGYVAPNFWLTEKVRRRKERIRRSLPDTIDLLVICVDAGLGLDQALLRVCKELALSHPDIQDELMRVQLEQQAGRPRMEAWEHLAERVKLPEITAFVSMLNQTERFGTPIVRALSRFAADLRIKRKQHAEEAAARTKIKIVFPLVFCIFPCLFIVLLAPAVLTMTSSLSGFGK